MENCLLNEEYEKVIKVHEKAAMLFQTVKVPTMMKNEYKIKSDQYNSMYHSFEEMKRIMSADGANESLEEKQRDTLKVWMSFELEMVEKLKEYM